MNSSNGTYRIPVLLNQTRLARSGLKRAKENVQSAQHRAELAKQRRDEANEAIYCARCQVKRAKVALKEAKAIAAKAELVFVAARERAAQGGKHHTMRADRPLCSQSRERSNRFTNESEHSVFQQVAIRPTLEFTAPTASALREVSAPIKLETGPWPECYD